MITDTLIVQIQHVLAAVDAWIASDDIDAIPVMAEIKNELTAILAVIPVTDSRDARLRAWIEQWRTPSAEHNRYVCADELESALLLVSERPPTEAEIELRGGHTRLNECSGWEKTKDLPLYDRISQKIQELSDAKTEVEHMLKASGHEMDILRSRAEAAEHRRAAAEYRAQRIVLDAELLKRAETAEAECKRLAAVSERPPDDRLRALAIEGAEQNHEDDALFEEGRGGHEGDFSTCPHPDCRFVRAQP
jgi:hypothetical protein